MTRNCIKYILVPAFLTKTIHPSQVLVF